MRGTYLTVVLFKALFSYLQTGAYQIPNETEGTFLMQEQADHINERHVFRNERVKTSTFGSQIDLVDLLKNISELTWEQNNEDVSVVHEGWNEYHGHFYLFVFNPFTPGGLQSLNACYSWG